MQPSSSLPQLLLQERTTKYGPCVVSFCTGIFLQDQGLLILYNVKKMENQFRYEPSSISASIISPTVPHTRLSSSYLVLPGTIEQLIRYYIRATPCGYHTHTIWGGRSSRRGDTYCSDLEYGMPCLAPRNNISTTYIWVANMTALLLLLLSTVVIAHRPAHATGSAAGSAHRPGTKTLHH